VFCLSENSNYLCLQAKLPGAVAAPFPSAPAFIAERCSEPECQRGGLAQILLSERHILLCLPSADCSVTRGAFGSDFVGELRVGDSTVVVGVEFLEDLVSFLVGDVEAATLNESSEFICRNSSIVVQVE